MRTAGMLLGEQKAALNGSERLAPGRGRERRNEFLPPSLSLGEGSAVALVQNTPQVAPKPPARRAGLREVAAGRAGSGALTVDAEGKHLAGPAACFPGGVEGRGDARQAPHTQVSRSGEAGERAPADAGVPLAGGGSGGPGVRRAWPRGGRGPRWAWPWTCIAGVFFTCRQIRISFFFPFF